MNAYDQKKYQSLLDASVALTSFSEQPEASEARVLAQRPHIDYQTVGEGLEYFFLGNGLIQAAIQHSSNPASGTVLGILLMHPEHFARKSSTFLYHPETGIERTMMTAIIDDRLHYPKAGTLEVHWEYPDKIPTVVAEWKAGRCTVREEFWCPVGVPVLVRVVRVRSNSSKPVRVQARTMLYPNPMFFDEQSENRKDNALGAIGYFRLFLSSLENGEARDRWVTVPLGELQKGAEGRATFFYTLDRTPMRRSRRRLIDLERKTSKYWESTATFQSHKVLDHLFRTSKAGLFASISRSGKMDSGIWQYNQEWVRDQCMVVTALAMSAQTKRARALLERMMEKMVSAEGITLESSRWRGPDLYELDQNGELLYAHGMYWRWSGDDSLIKKYWKKIVAVADFPLRDEFWNHDSGLLFNAREFWERSAPHGVREGYELAYQLWCCIGLKHAAEMAKFMNRKDLAEKWAAASEKLRHAMLTNPRFALIEGGRIIKRRLATGEVQTVFTPPDRSAMPPGLPLATEELAYCEPDTQEALPIALELVPPDSGLARNTMMEIEKLWSQRWESGGYARYNVASEPDSPGPWPFATMFVARAYLEMGDHKKVWRALEWLYNVQGGKAGTWFEVYCNRPVPPLPPVGVTPWNWAEILIFFVHHLLGVRPGEKELVIRPKLLSGLKEARARVKVRGKWITLHLRRGRKKEARVDGRKFKLSKRTLTVAFPPRDVKIEMTA